MGHSTKKGNIRSSKKGTTRGFVPNWDTYPLGSAIFDEFGGNFRERVTDLQLEYLMLRDPAGRKVVVGPAKDAFKRPPTIYSENEDFMKEANALMERLGYYARLEEAYESARGWGFGLVALGLETVSDFDQPPNDVRGIANVVAISKKQVKEYAFSDVPSDARYGQIKSYKVKFTVNKQTVERVIDAGRVQHVTHDVHNSNPEGVSVLLPLYDALQGKKGMDLALAMAILKYAMPFTTVTLPADATSDEFEGLSQTFYLGSKGRNEFIMPYGYEFNQYGATNALNPDPYIKYMWEQICAGSEYDQVQLKGTEAGAVTGSWVNQAVYFGHIADIQKSKLEPHIVDFLRKMQGWGVLSAATFEVRWPVLWELDQKELAQLENQKAQSLMYYSASIERFKGMGFDVQLDEKGFYIQAGGVKHYLMELKGQKVNIQAQANSHQSAHVCKYDPEASRKLWDRWGYNDSALVMRYKAAMDEGYIKIYESLWQQTELILEKHVPMINQPESKKTTKCRNIHKGAAWARRNNIEPSVLAKDVQVRLNQINEAIDEITKKLKIDKMLGQTKLIDEMMKDGHKLGWESTATAMNQDVNWRLADNTTVLFLQRSNLLWEQKNTDCLGAAKNQIVEGILAGESYKAIEDRIKDAITQVARPAVFVQTEVHRAAELGRTSLYKEMGVEKVEWLTAGDERVRPEHAAREGQIFTIAEAEALIHDFGCRCSLLPVIPSVEELEAHNP